MIGFAAPWVLATLILLPALWWLLRITPPAPRLVRFPAIRLLRDLVHREETPARTPLWLVLMRLLLATALIVALAGPILRPSTTPPGQGPEILVVDNGWGAADSWPTIRAAMLAEIDRAERAGMPVVLLPTARAESGSPLDAIGPLAAGEARRTAEALEPVPWAASRAAAADRLGRFDGRSSVLWLSDGLESDGTDALATAVAQFAEPRVLEPAANDLPRLLSPPEMGPELSLKVRRPKSGPALPLTLIARGPDGQILAQADGGFAAGDTSANIRFDVPSEVRNEIARIDIAGSHSVGGTVLLDERWRRRPVGIISAPGGEAADELLSGAYYLERALQPYAEVRTGELATLLQGQPAVLIATDGLPLSTADRRAILDWVNKGGLFLRFAGPHLAAADPTTADPLVPTQLRTGGRSLSGALAWTEPAPLAPFPETGPFAGLDAPKDVTVSRQVLAEPSVDLDKKVWARLADGTPLITADRREAGMVVLVHTSASPSWSNLALSGLFPQMLRRIVAYSAGVSRATQHGVLQPYRLLDGFARLVGPSAAATAVQADRFDGTAPDPLHPPGYYGEADSRRALNLSQTLTTLLPLGDLPTALKRQAYEAPGEVKLAPALFTAALLLAVADTIVALWLGGGLPRLPRLGRRAARVAALSGLLVIATGIAHAGPAAHETSESKAAQAASQVTLGYIATGDAATDRVSRAGLEGLSRQLILRTSIDHAAPAEVNLDRDELSVYPLLYWPIAAASQPLSDQAKEKLNRYLASGGMVLIDTRAGAPGTAPDLGKLIQGLDVPALVPIPSGHVLTKSFYLLDEFPGRVPGGDLWVERDQDARNDGVSSVVVGSADWAGAWATDASGTPLYSVTPGGEKQREWAYRFGVNLVMYALTGNYKSDLVHAPFIHERLGQ
ncbi:MAG TPA: DUF4159 domain-containing protein [Alphaproteobacteria bacterium]|nr:DUF4159 domain-containing protein [Alphaproteobacteria bacterium]